jgi:hypothetical protein
MEQYDWLWHQFFTCRGLHYGQYFSSGELQAWMKKVWHDHQHGKTYTRNSTSYKIQLEVGVFFFFFSFKIRHQFFPPNPPTIGLKWIPSWTGKISFLTGRCAPSPSLKAALIGEIDVVIGIHDLSDCFTNFLSAPSCRGWFISESGPTTSKQGQTWSNKPAPVVGAPAGPPSLSLNQSGWGPGGGEIRRRDYKKLGCGHRPTQSPQAGVLCWTNEFGTRPGLSTLQHKSVALR